MTEKFTVSDEFSDFSARLIREAVKASKLEENINIVRWHEHETAKKPFAVVVYTADWEDVFKVMKAGAKTCIRFSTNVKKMTTEFDRKI